ncbi:MAG: ABC transporter ATP-binding protein [Acidimicrobiales bacterium]
MSAALEVADLTVGLGGSEVVRGVCLEVARGQVLGLVGPNGAGKTTFVDGVTGFVPASGTVVVNGRRVEHLRPHRRAALGLARTFQSLELFDDLTVGENLAVAAEAQQRRQKGAEAQQRRQKGAEAAGRRRQAGHAAGHRRQLVETIARAADAARVGDLLEAIPKRLSLGQRKGVALARALAADPSVLLLDEPAAGLDGEERRALVATLGSLAAGGMAVVLIDHDVQLVSEASDRVVVLDGGRVVASGSPQELRGDSRVAAAWLGPVTPSSGPAPRA